MANANRQPTKYPGVYFRTSAKRKDAYGKPDVVYDIAYKTKDGKKIWEKIGRKSDGISAVTARDIRAERMQEVQLGKVVVPVVAEPVVDISNKIDSSEISTFGEAWKFYYDRWVVPYCARPENEQSRYDRHVAPIFGETPMSSIKTLDIEAFKMGLLEILSPKTVQHVLALMRSVYNKLREWEVYDGPVPLFKMPKIDNARIRFLTDKESDSLLNALKKRSLFWFRAACISLNAGLRRGEILALTWGDIDLINNVIHVRRGKTGYRAAPINKTLQELFSVFSSKQPADLLFPSKNGTVLKETNVSDTFADVVKSLGLNDNLPDKKMNIVFHSLRHTFASRLVQRGVPLYTVSKLMGHSNMAMTNRYAHLCPGTQQAAVALLD